MPGFSRPASGLRTGYSGGLNFVGTNGFAWSSAPLSTTNVYSSNLDFLNGYIGSAGNGYSYRACGYPVRCVQE